MILKRSLTRKFIIAILLILLSGQLISTVLFLVHIRSSMRDSLIDKIRRTANITAGLSSGPLLSYDYSLIDAYIDMIIKDDDVTSVHILDAEGNVVREKIKIEDTVYKTNNPILIKANLTETVPVTVAGEQFGKVVIDYNAQRVNEHISHSMIMISLFQTIMFAVITLILIYLFYAYVKKPVGVLTGVMEKIASGSLVDTVPDFGEDEIGNIAKGISLLTGNLSKTVKKLYSTVGNVAMALQQVNVLHKNVTNGMKEQSKAIQDIENSIQDANKSQTDIIVNTERLSTFSTENVSSLLEMKATAEEIAVNTERLYKATEDSHSVVVEMTEAAKALSTTTNEGVSAVEDTSASVEEVGASVKEVEEHTRESSKLAEKVKEITSEYGMLAVVNAVEGMEKITDEVKISAEIIQQLGSRSMEIEKVLSVIKDVTEQTNLLSLNAAILAAQAGEYGKSFSVVADEISALSDRTVASTREIAGIVKNIQKDINSAIHSIDSTKMKVEAGHTLVMKVGEALKEVLVASEHSTDMTKAIQRAAEEQSIGLRQISAAIEDIRKMMNTFAQSSGEQEKSIGYLLDAAGEVKEVADISKRGTEEHASGTKVISKNIELANDKVTDINKAGQNQKQLNDNILAAMNQIKSFGHLKVQDMEEVAKSLQTLFEEIELLKKETEAFKL